jgi:hypothetical protein
VHLRLFTFVPKWLSQNAVHIWTVSSLIMQNLTLRIKCPLNLLFFPLFFPPLFLHLSLQLIPVLHTFERKYKVRRKFQWGTLWIESNQSIKCDRLFPHLLGMFTTSGRRQYRSTYSSGNAECPDCSPGKAGFLFPHVIFTAITVVVFVLVSVATFPSTNSGHMIYVETKPDDQPTPILTNEGILSVSLGTSDVYFYGGSNDDEESTSSTSRNVLIDSMSLEAYVEDYICAKEYHCDGWKKTKDALLSANVPLIVGFVVGCVSIAAAVVTLYVAAMGSASCGGKKKTTYGQHKMQLKAKGGVLVSAIIQLISSACFLLAVIMVNSGQKKIDMAPIDSYNTIHTYQYGTSYILAIVGGSLGCVVSFARLIYFFFVGRTGTFKNPPASGALFEKDKPSAGQRWVAFLVIPTFVFVCLSTGFFLGKCLSQVFF